MNTLIIFYPYAMHMLKCQSVQ